MNYSNTIFNQLLNFLPKNKFNQFVGQHNGDRYVKRLTAWNQLVLMLYAQATSKDSFREIETGFNMHDNNWYHLGVNSTGKVGDITGAKEMDLILALEKGSII